MHELYTSGIGKHQKNAVFLQMKHVIKPVLDLTEVLGYSSDMVQGARGSIMWSVQRSAYKLRSRRCEYTTPSRKLATAPSI
ncbi:hypothetical protein BC827DRAFT_1250796 [Russula dissimulans]|nr:hypothetical protein BC827DRAFT_1250796 [Russula dissimulans]